MKKGIVWSTLLLIIGTLFSKCLGFVREVLFAHKFGAGEVSDAFLLTRGIPEIIFSALAIAIGTNFIPCYNAISGAEKKWKFFSNLINICSMLTILGAVLINLFPRQILWVLSPALPQTTLDYAVVMLHIVSFSITPLIIGRLFQGYSQANGFFLSTALLGVVTNIVTIASYLLATDETFQVLSVGVVLAQIVSLLMLFWSAKKSMFHYLPILDFKDQDVRMMIWLTLPLIIGKLAEDTSYLVDRNLAASLGIGVLSSMAYALLLSNSMSSIVVGALVTSVFPSLSRLAAEGNIVKYVFVFQKYIRVLVYALSPICVFTFLFAEDLVVFVLEHGNLQAPAAKTIWECTACYAIGILPTGIHDYIVRGFYALRDTKTPAYIDIAAFLCNVGLSVLGARFFGHVGVTMATSASFFFAAVLLGYYFAMKYKVPVFQALATDSFFCLVLTSFSGILVYWLFHSVCVFNSIIETIALETLLFFSIYMTLFFATHREFFRQVMVMVKNRWE